MAKTIGDIIGEARVFIQDTEAATQRNSDEELLEYLNNGIYEIRRLRPDFFVNIFETDVPQYTTAQLTTEYPLDGQTTQALAYFIAANEQVKDDEYAVEGRAAGLMALFRQNLLVAG